MYECQVQAIGWSLYGFKRRYLRCRVGKAQEGEDISGRKSTRESLGDIVNTQRDVREAGSGRGRGKDRLEK